MVMCYWQPLVLTFVLFLFHILDGTVNQIEGKAAVGTDGILFTPYFFHSEDDSLFFIK